MTGISTHILDLSRGVGAAGVRVTLEVAGAGGAWTPLGSAPTGADGRVANLLPAGAALSAGTHRLRFATADYWRALSLTAFHPLIEVTFSVTDPSRHHHLPLLISPFGYSTYRGV
jgi:5-hydroxyisourate hydrolase